jgi:hypothetical protein
MSKVIHGNIPDWYDKDYVFEAANDDSPNAISTPHVI